MGQEGFAYRHETQSDTVDLAPARRQRQDAEDEARLDGALDDLKGIGVGSVRDLDFGSQCGMFEDVADTGG